MNEQSTNELNEASAANRVLEYEVYDEYLESVVPPLIFRSREDADHMLEYLVGVCGKRYGTSAGWWVREVVLNERPIPQWAATPTSISVEEGRRIAAAHGQDRLVLLAWNAQDKSINLVTVGSDKGHSEAAYNLGRFVAKAIGYDAGELLEDRREEHETQVATPVAE